MADVRSMLRAERATRRITHPNASYTSDGKLLCNLCEITIKSETAWGAHLHSSQHSLRLHRAQEAAVARGSTDGATTAMKTTTTTTTTSKKRKASTLESPVAEDNKRVRSTETIPMSAITQQRVIPVVGESESTNGVEVEDNAGISGDPVAIEPNGVNDAEFEAFEREIAAMDENNRIPLALNTEATISAVPLTAEQIANKNQVGNEEKRSRRDVELEAEREDAARLLEQEFDEMESLEQRVRRLRDKREALRKDSRIPEGAGSDAARIQSSPGKDTGTTPAVNGDANHDNEDDEDEDEDEEDDDDDEFDDWRFGSA